MMISTPVLLLLLAQVSAANARAESAARFGQAKALYDQGRFDEAAELFRQVHESTRDPLVLLGLANSLRQAGRCAAALTAFEGILEVEADLKQREAAASADSD